jgi:hypothetical protein
MTENIIKIWKEKNIDHVNFNFSCGGDSMNDTSIEIFDKEGELVEDSELETYFDDQAYKNVGFYVNSDGHYQGEFGVVTIEFDEDENDFTYSKSSSSEWNESCNNEVEIELSDKETKFVADYVLNINGGEDEIQTNYKKDFILTNEQEETLKGLEEKISEFAQDYTPNDVEGEMNEWHTFTTNEEGKELKLVGNMLTLSITKSFDIIKED